MAIFFTIIILANIVVLIVGLVDPKITLRWSKKPTRLKVLGLFVLIFIIIIVFGAILDSSRKVDYSLNINKAKTFIAEKKYESAVVLLKNIPETDSCYKIAQKLIHRADSLSDISKEEIKKKELEENRTKIIEQLKKEIKSIDESVDFSKYKESLQSLQIEVALFGAWSKMIIENKDTKDKDIKKLVYKLSSRIKKLQIKEFPLMRQQYTKFVKNAMWEHDISVFSNSKGSKYINFTGAIFASNKGIKGFHAEIHKALEIYRFKQARYRWYKGASEYTYYTIFEGKDSDLVELND